MTTDDRKRDLINQAADEIAKARGYVNGACIEEHYRDARAALDVFEAAQEPTDDEREALIAYLMQSRERNVADRADEILRMFRRSASREPFASHPEAVYSVEVFEAMHAALAEASGSPTHALRLVLSRQFTAKPQTEPTEPTDAPRCGGALTNCRNNQRPPMHSAACPVSRARAAAEEGRTS